MPFIAIYFHSEFGMSATDIGLFFGVMAVVRSVFQLLGGEFSDRVERRQLVVHAQTFRAGAFLLLALSIHWHWGFWAVAGCLLVNAVFGAVFHTVANALVSDILPVAQRLDGYAITRSAGNLGWAAGPAIGGFLASESYALLFLISAAITLGSGIVFWTWMRTPPGLHPTERFRLSDIVAIKDDTRLLLHSLLAFLLYLVVAQLIVPFSVYTVEMVGLTKNQLGYLFTLNGLMVVLLQLPATKLVARFRLTTQLALGALLYTVGYGAAGLSTAFGHFVLVMVVVTTGEIIMSPATLTLTSRLAPPGRMGRYMGSFGFFVAAGWSFGPLFGGTILDTFSHSPVQAWITISSLALVSAAGYVLFRGRLKTEDTEPAAVSG